MVIWFTRLSKLLPDNKSDHIP